jgi:hypothetical protein
MPPVQSNIEIVVIAFSIPRQLAGKTGGEPTVHRLQIEIHN